MSWCKCGKRAKGMFVSSKDVRFYCRKHLKEFNLEPLSAEEKLLRAIFNEEPGKEIPKGFRYVRL